MRSTRNACFRTPAAVASSRMAFSRCARRGSSAPRCSGSSFRRDCGSPRDRRAGRSPSGRAGLFTAWAYSAPPLKLNSRGLGEACVAMGFGLIAVGADYVQRAEFSLFPVVAVLPYALLVTNLLYINQFPELKADAATGKRHWV